jgi:hypothetical protein
MAYTTKPAVNHCVCDWCGATATQEVADPVHGPFAPPGWHIGRWNTSDLTCTGCNDLAAYQIGQLRDLLNRVRHGEARAEELERFLP